MSKINNEVKITSIKRINANRENAKKSTGPKPQVANLDLVVMH